MQSAIDLAGPLGRKPDLRLEVESGAALSVREFRVEERLGALFTVDLTCVSPDADVDFEAMLGRPARFGVEAGAPALSRAWAGVVEHVAQKQIEEDGLSTYVLRVVPELWLLTQTRRYRVFQQLTDPDIALQILASWSIEPTLRLSGQYKERRYRVQYGESDFVFLSRLLEDAGVTMLFDTSAEGDGALVLDDAPQGAAPRAPLPYVSQPTSLLKYDFVTQVEIERRVRPGRYVQQDLDYRRPPTDDLSAKASGGAGVEQRLERYHYRPGAFSFKAQGGDTPFADDRGAQRTDLAEGGKQVEKRLAAKRSSARTVAFVTSALDARPGVVVGITDHAKSELAGGPLLITSSVLSGSATGDWIHRCESTSAGAPYHPPLVTPKPRTRGVESATVVGPAGEEIHTDEFGRVRVQFHWDREGPRSEASSLWIPVSQPWGGTSFGALDVPRVGQEVLVDFLGADPDRPVVMGRVFTKTNPPPYKLPDFKSVQGIRSRSTPKLPEGAARSGMLGGKTAGGGDGAGSAGPQSSPLGGGMPFSMDAIARIVTGSNGAASPDAQTHGVQGSELVMHDQQGSEKVYLQAQKDFHRVVKNHQRGVVGHAKSTTVGTDRVREVGNKEAFQVGSDRSGRVGGAESVRVQGDILQASVTEGQRFVSAETYGIHAKRTIFTAEETFSSEARRHFIRSERAILLLCGESVFVLYKDGIIIDAPDILINPGEAIANAVANGKTVRRVLDEQQEEQRLAAALRREASTAEAIAYVRTNSREYTGELRNELYRRGFTHAEALDIIARGRGNRLDDR